MITKTQKHFNYLVKLLHRENPYTVDTAKV